MPESGPNQGSQTKVKAKRRLLTPRQMTIAFKKIIKEGNGDHESTHCELDQIMVETLQILGYENAMDVFLESTKYYA